LHEAFLDAQGIRFDRRWMVVEAETGRFLTQREYPQMALLQPTVTEDSLTISFPSRSEFCLPLKPDDQLARCIVTIWKFTGEVVDEGDEVAEWFSQMLGFPCRLVRTPDDFSRRVNPAYGSPQDRVGFADGYAILLASEESLADLNLRLPSPVPMSRFRPNLVVYGATSFAEDTWSTLTSPKGTVFRVAKPCARCAITTVDQSRGIKTGVEPLATLANYRRDAEGNVNFAVNLIHSPIGGTLRIGDLLQVDSMPSCS
jgi:hypothetical protein